LDAGTQSLAAVVGKPGRFGNLTAASVLITKDQYVAGATKVKIQGKVASVNRTTGQITVGNAVIDASAFISHDTSLSVGETVTIKGIQPVLAGVVLPDSLTVR
jgi:hypothetical protein